MADYAAAAGFLSGVSRGLDRRERREERAERREERKSAITREETKAAAELKRDAEERTYKREQRELDREDRQRRYGLDIQREQRFLDKDTAEGERARREDAHQERVRQETRSRFDADEKRKSWTHKQKLSDSDAMDSFALFDVLDDFSGDLGEGESRQVSSRMMGSDFVRRFPGALSVVINKAQGKNLLTVETEKGVEQYDIDDQRSYWRGQLSKDDDARMILHEKMGVQGVGLRSMSHTELRLQRDSIYKAIAKEEDFFDEGEGQASRKKALSEQLSSLNQEIARRAGSMRDAGREGGGEGGAIPAGERETPQDRLSRLLALGSEPRPETSPAQAIPTQEPQMPAFRDLDSNGDNTLNENDEAITAALYIEQNPEQFSLLDREEAKLALGEYRKFQNKRLQQQRDVAIPR